MTPSDIVTLCHTHERSYDRERTRALARQQWAKVIECDSKMDALERLRAAITKQDALDAQAHSAPVGVADVAAVLGYGLATPGTPRPDVL